MHTYSVHPILTIDTFFDFWSSETNTHPPTLPTYYIDDFNLKLINAGVIARILEVGVLHFHLYELQL